MVGKKCIKNKDLTSRHRKKNLLHIYLCIVLPEQDAVIAIAAHTGNMQAQLTLIWDKLLPAFNAKELEVNKAAQEKMKEAFASLKAKEGPPKK